MKKIKNFFIFFLIFTFVFSVFTPSILAETTEDPQELSDEEISNDAIIAPTENDTLSFVMKARWGFVRGNPVMEDRNNDLATTSPQILEAKDYDGSIFADDSSQAKISLIKKDHFESNDSVIDEADPVAWVSKIYGHWDGVYVEVMAKADAKITVKTTQGAITKTAREWYNLHGHVVQKFTGYEMLDVQTHRKDNRRHGIVVMWGRHDQQGPIACLAEPCPESEAVDFSGSLTMDENSYVKLLRPIRFEENDSINEHNRHLISWTSSITGGRDGLYVFMLPEKTLDINKGFTIKLDKITENGWEKHYTFAEAAKGQRDIVTVNDVEYVVIIGHKNIVRQVVRAKHGRELYYIENNIKRRVPNSEILRANGLDGENILELDDEELEIFAEGDNLTYPNGTIITEGGKTFVVADGVKRLLGNAKTLRVFDRLKAIIGGQHTSSLEEGEPVNSSEGIAGETLVKVPGKSAVWIVQGNKKKYFHRAQVFMKHRFDWDNVKEISQKQLDEFDFNGVVTYPDGTLVKTRDVNKVFLIVDGKLRWIETEEDFKKLGLKFGDVIDIELVELALYGEGSPIISE